nr:putative steryl acetyl hydrolase mug81 [Quercus suber]
MGSSYFYMEFLIAWIHMLKEAGYSNPAVVALEYTLVPEATYPTQVQQALAGYKYAISLVDGPSQVCVSGDSAGATLVLSLLLCLSNYSSLKEKMPALAIPISPWVTIISPNNKNTPSDYLNADSLHLYGSQYIGSKASPTDSMVSPGCCKDLSWWRRASPSTGWYFLYGAEEVFAPETKQLISTLAKAGATVAKEKMPALAIPISPWVTIISPNNKNTPSDYLNADSLHLYGSQYIGSKASPTDSMVSPGCCKDLSWWRRASPSTGWYFLYGAEEVFAPETKQLISTLAKAGATVAEHEEERWIHAWPVVKLFLCNQQYERQHGLRLMTQAMKERMPPRKLK